MLDLESLEREDLLGFGGGDDTPVLVSAKRELEFPKSSSDMEPRFTSNGRCKGVSS